MRPTRSSVNSSDCCESGFTIVELLVGMFLCAVVGTLVSKTLTFYTNSYRQDMLRLEIQQNVRGALDIVSMNIRQAGEGLDKYFPAVTLGPGMSPDTSVLKLRRKIVSEVFIACQPVIANSSKIIVSDVASITPDCLPVNLAASVAAWTAERTSRNNSIRIFVYDRVGKTGEFVDYSSEGLTIEGNNYLGVAGPAHNYPARSTSIYILEEFSFSLNEPTETLQLTLDGLDDEPQDVAYRISKFSADLTMSDETTLTTLQPADLKSWKDVRSINLTLEGTESWRGDTMTRFVKGSFFPRNILSK